MYQKRLLKFVKAHNGLFTMSDIAAVWKRSVYDVQAATVYLMSVHQIKMKKGILYAKH